MSLFLFEIFNQIMDDFVSEIMNRDIYFRPHDLYIPFKFSGFLRFSNFRFMSLVRVIIIITFSDETGSLYLHSQGFKHNVYKVGLSKIAPNYIFFFQI